MGEQEFRKLRRSILIQMYKLEELQIEIDKMVEEQRYAEIMPFKEKHQVQQKYDELHQAINDWKKQVEELPLEPENFDFIKLSRQFLSQFKDNTDELMEKMIGEINPEIQKLSEERQQALKEWNFKLAGELLEKMVGLMNELNKTKKSALK
jgi:translation elongation factor EF-G